VTLSTNNKKVKTGTYTYNFGLPAFMSLYQYKTSEQEYNTSDVAVGTAATTSGTLTTRTTTEPQFATYGQYSASNPTLCMMNQKYTLPINRDTENAAKAYPYELKCDLTSPPFPPAEL
jgi:hypothetical protein